MLSTAYGARRAALNLLVAVVIATPALAEPMTVVALGDSLTAGYGLEPFEGLVPQLQAWLTAQGQEVVILNAGVSGDTTAGARARIDWALTPGAKAMIVTLGGNDLLRGLPPDEARTNLDAILSRADAAGLPVLLIPMVAPGNYGPDYKSAFDAIYPDLATAHGATLAPPFLQPILSQPDQQAAMNELMQPDGLHPNAKGVALVVEALGPTVLALLDRIR